MKKNTIVFRDKWPLRRDDLDVGLRRYAPFYDFSEVLTLDWSNTDLKDINDISYYLPNLRRLIMRDNEISDLSGIEYLTSLMSVDLSGNDIKDIRKLGGLPNLVDVDLSRNGLYGIEGIGGLNRLLSFYAGNEVKEIDEESYGMFKDSRGIARDFALDNLTRVNSSGKNTPYKFWQFTQNPRFP